MMNESQFNKYISKIDTTFFKKLCLEKGTLKSYNKGDYISREGDIFPYWGYIESGIIKYTCYNATEKKNIIQDSLLKVNLWLIIQLVFIILNLKYLFVH